jgi:hypothetical protein
LRHLRHPYATRIHFYSKALHFPASNVDGEQHLVANQPEPSHRLNREEIHPDNRA